MRLQRYLAMAGMASRRQAEAWIAAGRVTVNGQVARLGQRVGPGDQVAVDGEPVASRPGRVVLALYKPVGYTTSLADPHAEHLVRELIPPEVGRVFPVGRLDRDSSGLLLLTNDGELAFRLTHPRFGVSKAYEVWVEGHPGPGHLRRAREGVELGDGRARAAGVRVLQRLPDRTLLAVTLREGKKREIRRLFEVLGHPVLELCRVRFGNVTLEGLKPGEVRKLTDEEVARLWRLVALPSDASIASPSSSQRRMNAQWQTRKTQTGWNKSWQASRRSGTTCRRTGASGRQSRKRSKPD